VSWQAYTVKPGERIEKIAAKNGMSVAELRRVNHLTGRTRVRTGQPLLVPVKAGVKPNLPNLPAPALIKTRTAKTRYVPRSRRGALARKAVHHQTVAKKVTKKASSTKAAKAPAAKRVKVTARGKSTPAKSHVTLAENH
jgi:LysM repeat protein